MSVLGLDTSQELASVSKAVSEISSRSGSLAIIVPHSERLDSLQKELESFGPAEIREALKIRDGKVYHVLSERGKIVKRNFENRYEIAKLSLMVSKLGKEEREAFSAAIGKGAIEGALEVKSIDAGMARTLVRLLVRCSIPACMSGHSIEGRDADIGEVRMEVSNRSIWIEKSLRPKLEENLKKMVQVNSLIQLRNAERQIKVFDSREEDEFSALQRQYLELLKEQDELLREYNEEEKH